MTRTSSNGSRHGWVKTSWATCTSSPLTRGGRTSAESWRLSKIVQTRGGWPFFEVDVTAAKANPADRRVAGSCTCTRCGAAVPVARRAAGAAGGPAAASSNRHFRKAWRRTLQAHHRSRQLRLADCGVQRPHHDARGGPIRGACLSLTSPKRRSSFRTSRSVTS